LHQAKRVLAGALRQLKEFAVASSLLESSLSVALSCGWSDLALSIKCDLGDVRRDEGDTLAAKALYEECAEKGHRTAKFKLAELLCDVFKEHARAVALCRELLAFYKTAGDLETSRHVIAVKTVCTRALVLSGQHTDACNVARELVDAWKILDRDDLVAEFQLVIDSGGTRNAKMPEVHSPVPAQKDNDDDDESESEFESARDD
jgi:hypothetical protein